MKTIVEEIRNEIIINQSRFITVLYPITKEEDGKEKWNKVKQEYKHATHYCYAYVMDQSIRQSDDGEPSKTAGIPMLEVLKKEGLDHILVIVIRYFGGIKLGASGLVRAYRKSVKEAIKKATITELEIGQEYDVIFQYDDIKKMEHQLKNVLILSKEYQDDVMYRIWIPDSKKENKLLESFLVIKIEQGKRSFQEIK